MTKSRKFAAYAAIVFFLTSLSYQSFAQDDDEEENPRLFSAGLIGGANFAQVDGDNFAGYHKVGLNVGGIGYLHLKHHTAISWEILYSQRGSVSNIQRPSNDDSTIILKYGININYAEIPVMFNVFDKHKSHLGLGLSYSQLVSSSETLTVDNPKSTPEVYNVDLSKYGFKKNALDVVASAQMHVWKGLFLNVRFQYSIIPIRTNVPPNYSRSNQYNNLWTVRLMYLFI